ncbi:hypothetical protein EYF80_036160 [Liparis tanakae]|uniref:Uncharacterized protein n=1 Tax=Liparis tanakae TaxID=230148 RepID=A0A4Z2GJE4_9TELE|nr:hypothetical protein EYF80_036160 [Liparis tanakae]
MEGDEAPGMLGRPRECSSKPSGARFTPIASSLAKYGGDERVAVFSLQFHIISVFSALRDGDRESRLVIEVPDLEDSRVFAREAAHANAPETTRVRTGAGREASNSLHLTLITSLVPHSLHLVLTPSSPAAPPLVSPSFPSPGPHALLTCSPSPH